MTHMRRVAPSDMTFNPDGNNDVEDLTPDEVVPNYARQMYVE